MATHVEYHRIEDELPFYIWDCAMSFLKGDQIILKMWTMQHTDVREIAGICEVGHGTFKQILAWKSGFLGGQ